jgi:hypothetical protein
MDAIASVLDCILRVSVVSFLRSLLLSPRKVTFAKCLAISGLFWQKRASNSAANYCLSRLSIITGVMALEQPR